MLYYHHQTHTHTRNKQHKNNIIMKTLSAIKVKLYRLGEMEGVAFPDKSDLYTMKITDEHGTIALHRKALLDLKINKNG